MREKDSSCESRPSRLRMQFKQLGKEIQKTNLDLTRIYTNSCSTLTAKLTSQSETVHLMSSLYSAPEDTKANI